jgi:hypothetical protein
LGGRIRRREAGSAEHGGGGLWMGSAGPWMGSAGLSTSFLFFLFFYLINQGGHQTALENVSLTVTFDLSRFGCSPRKIVLARLG